MNVNFYISDVGELRYLVPIAKVLNRSAPNSKIIFSYIFDNIKYNSIKNNRFAFNSILKEAKKQINFSIEEIGNNWNTVDTDILFSVENVPAVIHGKLFNYEKLFCVQHGTDYTNFVKYATNKTTYITSDLVFCNDIQRLGVKTQRPDIPVSFWGMQDQLSLLGRNQLYDNNKKTIFLFAPDDVSAVNSTQAIIDNLSKDNKYNILVKQRRKSIICNNSFVYDEKWFPSEGILFPAMSDVVIGVGTSAYCDLAPMGIHFIDNAIPEYSKLKINLPENSKYPGYCKPLNRANFYHIDNNFASRTLALTNKILMQPDTRVHEKLKNYDSSCDKFIKSII
jgi:hypothetical protein